MELLDFVVCERFPSFESHDDIVAIRFEFCAQGFDAIEFIVEYGFPIGIVAQLKTEDRGGFQRSHEGGFAHSRARVEEPTREDLSRGIAQRRTRRGNIEVLDEIVAQSSRHFVGIHEIAEGVNGI